MNVRSDGEVRGGNRRAAIRRTLVYLMVAGAWGVALLWIQQNYDEDVRRSCRDRAIGQGVLRDVIVVATAGGSTDYSRIPSFADLDPSVQAFLREVGAAQRTGGSSELRERLLAKAPPVVCKS